MASFRVDVMRLIVSAVAIAVLLLASGSIGRAADATDGTAALESQIEAQLPAMLPEGLRLDRVTLGCKPSAHAVLRTIAPGYSRLNARSFMVELGDGARSVFCPATIDASRRVMVAVHDLQPGQTIAAEDFQVQWVDAFSGAVSALSAFPEHGPYASATVIRAGEPLYQCAITRPIAIHPGDLVTVTVKNGPVRVRAQLQAQSQGAVGDSVTLVNPSSGMPVMVVVTGPHTAELELQ
jgi:flagella basal body P-ring formation protein FlgA